MSPTDIKIFDIEVGEDVSKIKDLMITRVRPDWEPFNIIQTVVGGGYVNQTLLFRQASDEEITDGIIVRIFGPSSEFICREREICAMQVFGPVDITDFLQIAHHAGCFPKVLAVFQNGIIHQYAPGRCLEGWEINDPRLARLLARSLAQLHSANLSRVKLVDLRGRSTTFPAEFVMFKRFYSVIDAFPAGRYPELPILKCMREEVDYIKTVVEELDLPRAPCCHGDFHGRNVIYNDKTDAVNFVDYECASCHIAGLDIMYMMDMYNYKDFAPGFPTSGHRVTDEVRTIWVTSYLERKNEVLGRSPTHPIKEEVDKMLLELNICEVLLPLSYASVCLSFYTSLDNLLVGKLYNRAMLIYLERKPSLTELAVKYKQLKVQQNTC